MFCFGLGVVYIGFGFFLVVSCMLVGCLLESVVGGVGYGFLFFLGFFCILWV